MPDHYSQINLAEIEDVAPANGFADRWQARGARRALGAQQTGVMYFRLLAGKRSPFAHRHGAAEEIYVILSGSGRLRLDDEIVEVQALDAIRVAPKVARAFEAGGDGLEFVAFGPHHPADGEAVDDDWVN
jgi:mannose-6-phosphate isomerase-like protein (cupin superfamily)